MLKIFKKWNNIHHRLARLLAVNSEIEAGRASRPGCCLPQSMRNWVAGEIVTIPDAFFSLYMP